jgi:hypothetical protein
MTNSPFPEWPEFKIGESAAPVGGTHRIADEIVDISTLTYDDMEATQRNVDKARVVIQHLLEAIEHHRERDHMCATTCVDPNITRVLDAMDLVTVKLVLLVLLKDLEYVESDDEESVDDDT